MPKRGGLLSCRSIATAFGVSRQSVAKWMRNPQWRELGQGPWTKAAISAWRARVLVGQNIPSGSVAAVDAALSGDPIAALRANPVRAAQMRLAVARAVLLEMDAKIRDGELVRRDEAQREELARALRVKSELMGLARSLPPRLRGIADETRQAAIIEEAVREALTQLAVNGNGRH